MNWNFIFYTENPIKTMKGLRKIFNISLKDAKDIFEIIRDFNLINNAVIPAEDLKKVVEKALSLRDEKHVSPHSQ